MIKVTIVIPCYNAQYHIETAIRQCVAQTFNNLEVIIVNDGSTDESLCLIQNIAPNYPHVKYYSTPNQGASLARKYGLERANGEFIFFMDADDELKPTAIESLAIKQAQGNYDIVVGQHEILVNGKLRNGHVYSANGAEAVQNAKDFLLGRFPIYLWGQLYRKSLVENIKFYNYQVSEDILINTQLILLDDVRIATAEEIVYVYKIRKDSLSQSISDIKTEQANLAHEESMRLIESKIDPNLISAELCFNHIRHLYALLVLGSPASSKLRKKILDNYRGNLGDVIPLLPKRKQLVLSCFLIAPDLTQKILLKLLNRLYKLKK